MTYKLKQSLKNRMREICTYQSESFLTLGPYKVHGQFYYMKHIILLFLLIIASCSNLFGGKASIINLKTSPQGAKVFVLKGSTQTLLGETPIEVKFSDLSAEVRKQKLLSFILVKEGYVSERIIFENRPNHKIEWDGQMEKIEFWNDPSNNLSSKIVDTVAKSLRSTYKEIRNKQYNSALEKITQLLNSYPDAPILYDIKGSILMLKGDEEEALSIYRRSLQLRPDNVDTQGIVQELETEQRKKR